jgi:hypothetical protein
MGQTLSIGESIASRLIGDCSVVVESRWLGADCLVIAVRCGADVLVVVKVVSFNV